jgi:ComF family protein
MAGGSAPLVERSENNIPRASRAIAQAVLDALFPWSCVSCKGRATSAVCGRCLDRVHWITEPWCPQCGLPLASPPSHLCGRCLTDPPAFGRLRALAAYRPTDEELDPIGAALRAMKYGSRRALGRPLSTLLADRFPFDPSEFDVITPVPLHLERLRARGFNQALLLACEVTRRSRIPLDRALLVRVRDTPPQVGLAESDRQRNVRRAFELRAGRSVEGRSVLVVDDVCTSTATARACATALRQAGASRVDVLVLARALLR